MKICLNCHSPTPPNNFVLGKNICKECESINIFKANQEKKHQKEIEHQEQEELSRTQDNEE